MVRSQLLKLTFVMTIIVCSASMVGCPSKDVVVIDNLPSIDLDQVWNDVVSFFTGGTSTPFEVGDIIVGSGGGGFLRRVLAVDQRGDKLVTETEFASLAEAIDDGTLKGAVTFTPEDFAKANVPLAKAGGVTIDLSGIVLYSKDGITVSISQGSITYAPKVSLDASFSNHKLVSFEAVSEGDLILDLNVCVQASAAATLNYEVDIIPPITQPFVFYIGPVPVAGTASLRFPFGIAGSVSGAASATTGFDSDTYLKMGASYSDGKWTNLSDFGTFDPNPHPLVVSISSGAGLDIYVKPTAGLNLYGCSDLTGFVQPYVAADAQLVPSPFTFVLTAGINGGIGYELGIFDINLIDKDWFFPGPQWELYRYSVPYDVPTTFTFTLP